MKKKECIEILKHALWVVENDNNEVRDLSYKLEADTVTQAHPTHPWVEKEFYDGIRRISITVEYKDGELVEQSREQLSKFMHNDKQKDIHG